MPAVQRVADRDAAGIDDADDVARKRFGHCLAVAAEEPVDARQPHLRVEPARCTTGMSLASRPEQMRRKATRSRWRGFMFAWILKTKPEKFGSVGSTGPTSAVARSGARRERQQRVEKRLDAEVVQARCRRRPASAARSR